MYNVTFRSHRIRRMRLASVAIVAFAAAVVTPLVSTNIAQASAMAELDASEAELAAAHASFDAATGDLADASDGAVEVYADAEELSTLVRPELLADPTVVEDLDAERARLARLAHLAEWEDDSATMAAVDESPTLGEGPADTDKPTADEILAKAEAYRVLAARYIDDADAVREKITTIAAHTKTVGKLTEAVVTSGASFAAQAGSFTKAAAPATTGLRVAVSALADTTSPAAERLRTFIAAYDAAKASHDAAAGTANAAGKPGATPKPAPPVAAGKPARPGVQGKPSAPGQAPAHAQSTGKAPGHGQGQTPGKTHPQAGATKPAPGKPAQKPSNGKPKPVKTAKPTPGKPAHKAPAPSEG